jgi:hypothetical protein
MLHNFQCAISGHGQYQVLRANGRNDVLTNKHTWDLRCSQRYCWRFHAWGMLHCWWGNSP